MKEPLTLGGKADRVVQWLTESHLWSDGGYPFDWGVHAGKLFVASLNEEGNPKLLQYELAELTAWYDRAEQHMKDEAPYGAEPHEYWPTRGQDFGDWNDAFQSTEPNHEETQP